MSTKTILGGVGLVAALALAAAHYASRVSAHGLPTMTPLHYTGVLTEGGAPVTGTRTIQISLHDQPSAGTSVCGNSGGSTAVTNGNFRVPLSDMCIDAISENPDLWVELTVDGTPLPRTKVGTVPFAVEAGRMTFHGASRSYSMNAGSPTATATTYMGDLGGHVGAKIKCEMELGSPTAHMCTTIEVLRAVATGSTVSDGWINGHSAGTHCTGWTVDAGETGSAWSGTNGFPQGSACGTPLPILCCDD